MDKNRRSLPPSFFLLIIMIIHISRPSKKQLPMILVHLLCINHYYYNIVHPQKTFRFFAHTELYVGFRCTHLFTKSSSILYVPGVVHDFTNPWSLKITTLYLHIGTRSGQPKQFKILLALYYYIGSLVWLDGVRRDGYQFI